MSIDQALQRAISHHQAGALSDAEGLYREILRAVPNHPDANHNLGVLAIQIGHPEMGLHNIKQALEVNPTQVQYWLTYFEALLQANQIEVARQMLAEGRQRGLRGAQVDEFEARIKITLASETTAALGVRQPKFSEDFAVLAGLLAQERYEELYTIAMQLIKNFPTNPTGWKIAGAIHRKMGNLAEAYAAIISASEIAPDDPEIHYNVGIILDEAGETKVAEASYRKAILLNPKLAVAYNNLGVNLHKQHRYEEAELSFKAALKQNPKYWEIYRKGGARLKELSQLDEAEVICQETLNIDNQYGDSSFNLDEICTEEERQHEAEPHYRNVQQISLEDAGTYNNLGNLLVDLGRLAEAEGYFKKAVKNNPYLADAWNNLGNLLSYGPKISEEMAAYHQSINAEPHDAGLVASVFLAVRHFIAGEYSSCQNLIESASVIAQKTGSKYRSAQAYCVYLKSLLLCRENLESQHNSLQCNEQLFIIGDSHTLGFQGIEPVFGKKRLKCSVEWIPGCKQWHLGNGQHNKYKNKFELIMNQLPRGSKILLVVGEIDCRVNEGILIAMKKSHGLSMSTIARQATVSYLDYVLGMAGRFGHKVIVSGVPAPNNDLNHKLKKDFHNVVEVIRTVNLHLKEHVQASGGAFFDIWAITDRGDGIAMSDIHLDDFHVKPSVYINALRTINAWLDP